MANRFESADVLRRVQSPSNSSAWGRDPFVVRRRAEISSGLDDWLPDADAPEYVNEQQRVGGSRADLRSAGMSRLRQILGLGEVEHGRAMQLGQQKGEYDVAGQVAGQQAAMDRLLMTQEGLNRRATESAGVRREVAGSREEAAMERLIEALTGRRGVEEFRQGEMNRRAGVDQSGGWLQTLMGYLFGGGKQEEEAPEQQQQTAPQVTGRRPPRIISVE